MKCFYRLAVAAALLTALVFSQACNSYSGDDRSLKTLVLYMEKETGGKFDCMMEPGPFHAMEGMAIRLDGRQVAFYKYDPSLVKQLRKLKYVDEHGCLYFLGEKISAMRNGPFVMLDHETNKQKEKLVNAFRRF